jgi:aminoglycoside 3-N-acetyltransferase
VAKTLAEYCGKKGLLMMPSFNFPFYLGRNDDEYFDVKETPSCVGIISDEFRKLPEVVRSLNPSHSMAVYGKKNFNFIKDHHKVRTMDENSPLGKLEEANGYALMIGCPDSVTFMHVVEMTNNVHCLGQRTEEYQVKLPDGRIENIRTWGWRSNSCPGYNKDKIFNYLRKHKLIKEVMVRHSLWQYFKLSDYRKAYKKVVLEGKCGCMHCNVAPRLVKNTVISDWNSQKNKVNKDSTSFVGDWSY